MAIAVQSFAHIAANLAFTNQSFHNEQIACTASEPGWPELLPIRVERRSAQPCSGPGAGLWDCDGARGHHSRGGGLISRFPTSGYFGHLTECWIVVESDPRRD